MSRQTRAIVAAGGHFAGCNDRPRSIPFFAAVYTALGMGSATTMFARYVCEVLDAWNSGGRKMMANVPPFDRSDLSCSLDPGLPYFLDGSDIDSDDLGDWWLDLGAVDFNGLTGV
jgi:hypothetical protein